MLGERVLQISAVKLCPYLPEALRSLRISTDDYSEVVELIWREATKSKTTVGLSDRIVQLTYVVLIKSCLVICSGFILMM